VSESFSKLACGVLMAAVLFSCVILVTFGGAGAGGAVQIVAGFGIGAVIGAVAVIFRAPILWFFATVLVLGVATVAILLHWKFMAVGAGAALADAALLWYGWIRPNTSKPFNHVDYAKEQARIYEEEKAGKQGPGAVGRE
jgi:hypothetical protein